MKKVQIINMILFIGIILLAINLVKDHIQPNLILNEEKLGCIFYDSQNLREMPLDLCCLELQKQVVCTKSNATNKEELICYVSKESERGYTSNLDTINYCKREGYEIKIQ